MNHLVLLGDSIFDNHAYVAGGPAVIDQVQQRVPQGWQGTLLAVDGNTAAQIPRQLQRLPAAASHLVLSVGGNDALGCLPQLGAPAANVVGALGTLSAMLATFRHSYTALMAELLALNKPLMVCTVYDAVPGLTDPLKAALGMLLYFFVPSTTSVIQAHVVLSTWRYSYHLHIVPPPGLLLQL